MRKANTRRLLLIVLAAIGIFAAVRFLGADGPPSSPADITGDIAAVEDDGRLLLIQTSRSSAPDYLVRITNRTHIFRSQDGGVVRAGSWSPAAGQRVQVWFDGPILESSPARTAAGTILVLD